METNEQKIRGRLVEVTGKCLDIVEQVLEGKRQPTDLFRDSIRVMSHGVKIMHMNQIREMGERSQAMRLLSLIPKGKERERYIKILNPQKIGNLLLGKPEKR